MRAVKFNGTSDGPQNGVKTTATDIGEFRITVLYAMFPTNSVSELWGHYVCPSPTLFRVKFWIDVIVLLCCKLEAYSRTSITF